LIYGPPVVAIFTPPLVRAGKSGIVRVKEREKKKFFIVKVIMRLFWDWMGPFRETLVNLHVMEAKLIIGR